MGLRHRRSDPIVITDRSSSLCVHGPPGSIRWAELVCGRFSAAPTNSRRGGDTAPSYDSSVRRRTPSVHRNRRGTRTVVEGRASIVTSPGGTAAPGSWIHHVGVLNADRVLMRRRRASEETRRRRGWCDAAAPQKRRDGAAGATPPRLRRDATAPRVAHAVAAAWRACPRINATRAARAYILCLRPVTRITASRRGRETR